MLLVRRWFVVVLKNIILFYWTNKWHNPFQPLSRERFFSLELNLSENHHSLHLCFNLNPHKDFFGCSALLVRTRLTSSASQALFSAILVTRKDW